MREIMDKRNKCNKLKNWIVIVFKCVASYFKISTYCFKDLENYIFCFTDIEDSDEKNIDINGLSVSFKDSSGDGEFIVKIKHFNFNKHFIESIIIDKILEFIKICTIDEILSMDLNSEEAKEKIEELIALVNNDIEKRINIICGSNSEGKDYNFNLIKALSNVKYEKNKCKGNIIISELDIDCLMPIDAGDGNNRIYFNKSNERIIRKLLEVACNDFALCVIREGTKYYVKGFIESDCGEGRKISIYGSHNIAFYEYNELVVKYFNGGFYYDNYYEYVFSDEDLNLFNDHFKNKQGNTDLNKIRILQEYSKDIRDNTNLFHGAIIVISDDHEFISRMCEHMRAIKIYSKSINLYEIYDDEETDKKKTARKLLAQLCCVDGAVVFDEEGNLEVFGCILDGVSQKCGNRERGSRFNSTKTFIEYYAKENKNNKYFAIVMSENGPMNVFSS